MAGVNGVSAYQQTNQVWNQRAGSSEAVSKSASQGATDVKGKNDGVKNSEWKANTTASLIPTQQKGVGMAIGDVQLSDKAKDYYNKLKSKFGNMEFIAVSKDMKEQVKANAAAYGNANKMVVLIDDEKLERMANDEAYRKKYEGIIAMSQAKMASAKNSFASSGANVKNFGMHVNADGSTSCFATLEKSTEAQTKRIEKKQAEKKAAKAKEKKAEEKKTQEKRLEKAKEDKKSKETHLHGKEEENPVKDDNKEYVKFEADSMEGLVHKVTIYAYQQASEAAMTEAERNVGQNFDFRG